MESNTDQPPEQAVERAMTAVRRRQNRRILAEATRRQGVSSSLIAVAELLDAVDAEAVMGRTTTVTELAAQLRMDQPRVTRLVALAVAEGLLERSVDASDGRRSLLTITNQGRAVLANVTEHRRRQFAQAMTGWTDDERATFADLLTRFVDELELLRSRPGAGG